jgi:hypothetical protein
MSDLSEMSEVSSESVIKEDVAPRENRRKARKKLAYIEPLEEPGTIYNAEVHGAAQRLLKVHRITKYVKFCRCCSLPQETPSVVVPFNWFDEQLDFGIGIYLYFYFIKYCFIMAIICIGLSSISTIVFSESYVNDIEKYCKKYVYNTSSNSNSSNIPNITDNINETNIGNNTLRMLDEKYTYADLSHDCKKYIEIENSTDDDTFKADWLSDMSSYNIKSYYDVFKYKATKEQIDNIDKVVLEYSFMYFLTGICVLITNYLFIQIVSLLSQYENFKETTPADYAALIHGVPRPIEENGKMKDEVLKLVQEVSEFTIPLRVDQIIPCLRIKDIYEITEKKYKEETKLYHVYNFEKQIKLNKEKNFSKEKNNLHYFKNYICFNKKTPVQEIEKNIEDYRIKFNEMQTDLNENPNKYNGGTFFVVFENMLMKDEFCDFFPQSNFTKLMYSFRYFFENCLLRRCMNEQILKRTKLKLSVDVVSNVEPYEVEWENMGYTRCERNMRLLFSIVAFLVLVAVELGIIILLNLLQNYVAEKEWNFWKYVISFLISIIIAITNFIGKLLFKKLTFLEKIEIKTHFYISYSIKLTIFTFVTIAILPLVSNLIFGLDNIDILVNNLFMIFITNIILPPLLFYIGPDFVLKMFKKAKARLELKNVKYEKSTYTQGELNEIFENPEMDICFKYSYISNIFLISLFYMSIFPIGMIFGLLGLILAYVSEFLYIGFYKRPEILNSQLCRFYVSNFKWAIFIFALGNYIFLGSLNKNQRVNWSLFNLIFFFVLSVIPYQAFKINPIGESEGEHKYDTYSNNFIYFSTDYEKLNPFTRKKAYTKYFQKIIDLKIIDPTEGKRIIKKVQNTNEMTAYLSARRHLDYYTASQELNNIYMKNKNELKIQYMFGESNENKQGFSLTGLKNIIMDKSELNEEKMTSKDIDAIREMKDTLLAFSTTNTGICNALIFLGEKNNINDEFDNYHFNPWKAEWIFTPEYKMERKAMIHKIRSSMDYRGEISDDEDSIVKFDDKKDSINEVIKKLNDKYLKKRESVNVSKNEKDEKDQPMINNAELTNVEVNNNKLKLSKKTDTQESKGTNLRNSQSDSNQRLSLKEIVDKNNKNIAQSENNINTSESKLITDSNLFPKDTDLNLQKFNQQK